MSFKPVVLIYDLDNNLVDGIAAHIGNSGLYTTINTYNESNAMDVIKQYDRLLGIMTNKLSCVITGWNNHKKPSDQFPYSLRAAESHSPFRNKTPMIIVTEDHLGELKKRALDPAEGAVSAYLHADTFKETLMDILHQIVFEKKADELNAVANAQLLQESGFRDLGSG